MSTKESEGDLQTIAPKFLKVCELLPELTWIVFSLHIGNRRSNTLVSDLAFTSSNSTGETDRITFNAWENKPILLSSKDSW